MPTTDLTPATPESRVLSSVNDLMGAHQAFRAHTISSVEHARQRELALGQAVFALGEMHGIAFQQPLHIDSRGEFALVVMPPDGRDPAQGTGQYGEAFVGILNGHNPRTGAQPTRHMSADNGWCRINHFDLERLVLQEGEKLLKAQALLAKEVAHPSLSGSKPSLH
jgi:hypothetical protein